jgi:hypothetical protein
MAAQPQAKAIGPAGDWFVAEAREFDSEIGLLEAQFHDDLQILRRLAAGLAAPDSPPGECRYTDPLRGPSHAQYVMTLHGGHRCSRYAMAAGYTEARP